MLNSAHFQKASLHFQKTKTFQPTPKNIPSLNGLVIEKSLPSNGPHVLTQEPLEMIRSGNYTKIPLLMGYNNLEGMLAEVNHGENLTVNFEWQVPYALNLEEDSESYKEVARRIRHFYYGIAEPTKENLNIYFMVSRACGNLNLCVGNGNNTSSQTPSSILKKC